MPWCEECSRFLTPNSMGEGGECPSCGRVVAGAEAGDGEVVEEPHVPWHFKLLVLATIVYLAWRAVQGLVWLAGRF
jgi:hypothetical protein